MSGPDEAFVAAMSSEMILGRVRMALASTLMKHLSDGGDVQLQVKMICMHV